MGRPGTASVAAAGASTTERLAQFAAETAAITVKEPGKVGSAVQTAGQTAVAAAKIGVPAAGAVAAGKYLATHSAMGEVEKREVERKKKRKDQGSP